MGGPLNLTGPYTAYVALEKYLCSFQARGIVIIAGMSTDISHRVLSRTTELHGLLNQMSLKFALI